MLSALLNGGFTPQNIMINLLVLAVVAFVVFPMRCAAEAFVAFQLGDPTPKMAGRLTMNPRAHMDIFGTIMVFLCGIGFMKPVPMNPYNFRNRRAGIIMTSLAGPVAGFLVAFLAVGLYRLLSFIIPSYTALVVLQFALISCFASINISLSLFTLLPIPFLDGYQIVAQFLPSKWVYFIERNAQIISIGLLILIFSGVFSGFLGVLTNGILRGMLFVFGLR